MGKKSDAAEIDRRIHTVVKMLASAKTSSYVIRFCSEEWGVGQRMAEKYLARAREVIKADYSIERSDFLGLAWRFWTRLFRPLPASSTQMLLVF